jgi:HAE1 family hydrophobic/amphiphilic exporter-1
MKYTLRYKGDRLSQPIEYENIILTSKTTGQTLKLKDVAKIELGSLMYNVSLGQRRTACLYGYGAADRRI